MMHCSFCSKPQQEVWHLIACPDSQIVTVYICDDCVDICNLILDEESIKQFGASEQAEFYDNLALSIFPETILAKIADE